MEEHKVFIRDIDVRKLRPYIPLLQEYIGLPFPQLELACLAAERETNPEAVHEFRIIEFVPFTKIEEMLSKHFDPIEDNSCVPSFLWLVANLYYCGNTEAQEASDTESVLGQIERSLIRDEIAQLYTFIQQRKALRLVGDEQYGLWGRPIAFESEDKTVLRIHNTSGWFEALLENHLFPNCLPDVANDEDAQRLWKKENRKVGRKPRTNTNAIIHGVESFLHDVEIVKGVAPTNLCEFLFDYLDAMGYLSDPTDRYSLAPSSIKAYIHNLRKETASPQLNNVVLENKSVEELSRITPEEAAYNWLFPPKHAKEEAEG